MSEQNKDIFAKMNFMWYEYRGKTKPKKCPKCHGKLRIDNEGDEDNEDLVNKFYCEDCHSEIRWQKPKTENDQK